MKTTTRSITWNVHVLHPEVSGSCFLLSIIFPNKEKKKIIIDCGMFQMYDVDGYNYSLPFNPQTVDYVFLTHNHTDHCGRLPLLVSKGYSNDIYCTELTKEMLKISLPDSGRIVSQTSSNLSKRKGRYIPPIYESKDVYNTFGHIKTVKYNETKILDDNVSVTFLGNGHLLGAASFLIQLSYPKTKTVNLLFTGDYKEKSDFQDVPQIPTWVKNLDVIIFQEATYGDSTTKDIVKKYDEDIISLIEKNYTVLQPVIACERTEQILLRLKNLQETGKISTKVPIYLDGPLAIDYLLLYLKHSIVDFLPKNLHIILSKEKSYDFMRKNKDISFKQDIFVESKIDLSVLLNGRPKIILSTSGMADHGNAKSYISLLADKENTAIYFTCFTPQGTLGYKLKNLKKGKELHLNVYGEKTSIIFNATVLETSEFSAHARGDKLIDYINSFKTVSGVFINHGDESVKLKHDENVLINCNVGFAKVLTREIYYSLSGTEITKSGNSKFDSTVEVIKKIYSEPSKKKKEKLRRPRPGIKSPQFIPAYYKNV